MSGPDIFLLSDARKLLENRRIFLFGDSNMRAIYKDILWLVNYNRLLSRKELRMKLERNFANDILVKNTALTKARSFEESREFQKFDLYVKYTFLTRCYNDIIEGFLLDVYRKVILPPDIVILNSCLWDIARWGPQGVKEYQVNLKKLVMQLKVCLPPSCRVIWLTTLPLSPSCKGAFLKPVGFLESLFPYHIMEANTFSHDLFVYFGYDVLDLHFHMRWHVDRQVEDGVHWSPEAMRFITNLVLTHLSLLLGIPLPRRAPRLALQQLLNQETAVGLVPEQSSASN